jgi:hypothetical protein
MRTSTRKQAAAFLGIVLLSAGSAGIGSKEESAGVVRLNRSAFEYAQELIRQGHVIADSHGDWAQHQPSAERENEFIRQHGFAEFAKWHLGIDERHAENSKVHHKFPYGDFTSVRRSALLAVKSRARQYGYVDVENAAVRLLEMIGPRSQGKTRP